MEIFIVRHGESEGNRDNKFRGRMDFSLTERGQLQAKETGNYLKQYGNFDIIFTSPLIRAKQTADILSTFLNSEVVVEQSIHNIKLGEWEGKGKDEIRTKYPDKWQIWIKEPEKLVLPNGESIGDVKKRSTRWLLSIVNKDYKKIVVVTHRAVIKPLLAGILEVKPPYFWKFHIDTGSFSIVRYERNIFTLALLNQTSHLTSFNIEKV